MQESDELIEHNISNEFNHQQQQHDHRCLLTQASPTFAGVAASSCTTVSSAHTIIPIRTIFLIKRVTSISWTATNVPRSATTTLIQQIPPAGQQYWAKPTTPFYTTWERPNLDRTARAVPSKNGEKCFADFNSKQSTISIVIHRFRGHDLWLKSPNPFREAFMQARLQSRVAWTKVRIMSVTWNRQVFMGGTFSRSQSLNLSISIGWYWSDSLFALF